jgi:hypothetical protein
MKDLINRMPDSGLILAARRHPLQATGNLHLTTIVLDTSYVVVAATLLPSPECRFVVGDISVKTSASACTFEFQHGPSGAPVWYGSASSLGSEHNLSLSLVFNPGVAIAIAFHDAAVTYAYVSVTYYPELA